MALRADGYGQAQVLSSSVGLGLRLPGQWEETEASDLAQNWHRNYDQTLGRYVEADPLGIKAGQNLYAYVDGDPLTKVDPRGLGPQGAAWGAVVGTAIAGLSSIAADAGTGGVNVLATPAELALGGATGAAIGGRVEDLIAMMSQGGSASDRSEGRSSGDCPNDHDYCDHRRVNEEGRCWEKYGAFWGASSWPYRGCMERARERYLLCRAGRADDLPEWTDEDFDGSPRRSPPPRRRR